MSAQSHWLLALESSTPNGGAALSRDGRPVESVRLTEGLRHGRELMPAAARLLEAHGLAPADLRAVAVSVGPGSYTGLRVGVMAAKALAYGAGCLLAGVSSLAALAAGCVLAGKVSPGGIVCVVQDARRDEVYLGLYREADGAVAPLEPDAAVAPEEAAKRIGALTGSGSDPLLAGSAFVTYPEVFSSLGSDNALPGAVDPAAVAVLGWRQIVREETADPMLLQPVYLRRDSGHDWTRDQLIVS